MKRKTKSTNQLRYKELKDKVGSLEMSIVGTQENVRGIFKRLSHIEEVQRETKSVQSKWTQGEYYWVRKLGPWNTGGMQQHVVFRAVTDTELNSIYSAWGPIRWNDPDISRFEILHIPRPNTPTT